MDYYDLRVWAIIAAMIGAFVYVQVRTPSIRVDAYGIRVTGTMQRVSLTFDEIEEVTLLFRAPRVVRRLSGMSWGQKLRGRFVLEEFGEAGVFVERSAPPYLYLRARSSLGVETLIVNREDEEVTRSMYLKVLEMRELARETSRPRQYEPRPLRLRELPETR